MDERALGKRLQLARRRAGLTQQELCQKAGLSYSTLAKIERGAIRSPSVFTVANIARITGTPVEDLLDLPPQGTVSNQPIKKRSKNGVTFVFFDVNGTLVRYYQRAFVKAANEAGKSSDLVETFFWRHNDQLNRGELDIQEFNSILSRELGSNFDWRRYYMDSVEAMPGMDELVRWVAENYEVGIMSNNIPGFIDELKSKGLLPDVSYKSIVDSCKIGAAKPDSKIYKTAQELANVEAKEILLVDDTRPFLTAADHQGWQVFWFDELNPESSIERIKEVLQF